MDRFSKYNPKSVLLFFLVIIIQTLLIFNPIYLGVSFICALIYKFFQSGKKAFSYVLKFVLPIIVLTSVFNMLFAHYGMTVLFTIGGTGFTLESFFYGFTQGLAVTGVMLWLSAYNEIVSSEMLLSVFGRIMPNTAMIFSMSLTFIPRIKKNAAEINDARKLLDKGKPSLKSSVNSLLSLIMLTLEESIDVNDSMKARGFEGKRTVYSKYRFSSRDALLIASELVLFALVLLFKILGKTDFIIDPIIMLPVFSAPALTAYGLLALLPVIVDILEEIKWNYLKQKI